MFVGPAVYAADDDAAYRAKRSASDWGTSIVSKYYDFGKNIDVTVADAAYSKADAELWAKVTIRWKGPFSGDDYWAVGEVTQNANGVTWKETSRSDSLNGYIFSKALAKGLLQELDKDRFQPLSDASFDAIERDGAALRERDWALPPLVAGKWAEVTRRDGRKVVAERLAYEFKQLDQEMPRIGKMRVAKLPCYEDGYVCEVQTQSGRKAGTCALLMADQKVSLLNGVGPAFMKFNESVKLRLRDETEASEYLRLFCAGLGAADGTFQLVERADELHWTVSAPSSEQRSVAERVKAVSATRLRDGSWRVTGNMMYGKTLFSVHMTILPDGQVNMTDDRSLLEDLHVSTSRFIQGMRVPD